MASKLIWLSTSFKTNKSVQCTPFRVSIFLLLLLLGILNIQSIIDLGIGRDPPLFELSNPKSQCSTNSTHHLLLHRSQIDMTSSSAWDSQHHAAYEVCVVIVIGHDSGKPSETALPFSVLRRLFQMVFKLKGIEGEEVGLVEHDLQGVLVRVDYTSVVCKMVRDALGHSATCQSLLNLPKSKQQVLTLASYAYRLLLHNSFERFLDYQSQLFNSESSEAKNPFLSQQEQTDIDQTWSFMNLWKRNRNLLMKSSSNNHEAILEASWSGVEAAFFVLMIIQVQDQLVTCNKMLDICVAHFPIPHGC